MRRPMRIETINNGLIIQPANPDNPTGDQIQLDASNRWYTLIKTNHDNIYASIWGKNGGC